MKNQIEIVKEIADGMEGIGGNNMSAAGFRYVVSIWETKKSYYKQYADAMVSA